MSRRAVAAVCVLTLITLGGGGATAADVPPADCETLRSAGRAADASPVGVGACPGVRPGALVVSEDLEGENWQCTFGFVFDGYDPRDDAYKGRYISTAGTCVLPWEGIESWPDGEGPKAFDSSGRPIGHYVYAHSAAQSNSEEFALIKVAPGIQVNPQVCYFGGPTGLTAEPTGGPTQLRYVGQGARDVVPGRTAVALNGLTDHHVLHATGAWIPNDTGGPVVTEHGAAVGTVTAGAVLVAESPDVVTLLITRLARSVDAATEELDIELQLVTAPLLE